MNRDGIDPEHGSDVAALQNLAPVIRAIVVALRKQLSFERLSVVLTDEDQPRATAIALYEDAEIVLRENIAMSANIQRVIDTGEPLVNAHLTAYDTPSSALVQAGIRSTMIAPLRLADTIMGTLNIGSTQPGAYDEQTLDKLCVLAEQFSHALYSARQFSLSPIAPSRPSHPDPTPQPAEADSIPLFLFRPERILDQMSEALLIDDVEGRIIFGNRAFRKLFGITPDEELGTVTLEDYVAPEWRERLRQRHEDRIRGLSVPSEFEYIGIKRDGTRLDLEVTVVPIIESGVTLGTQSVIRDVTERRELTRRHAHAQKMEALGQLAGGIAHEFNNLLSALVAYPDVIRTKLAASESVEQDLSELELAAERAAMLTKQLLTFSRKQIVQATPVSVGQTLTALSPIIQHLLADDIALHLNPSMSDDIVQIDPGQLEQIIVNLVINARDAQATAIEVGCSAQELDDEDAQRLSVEPGRYVMLSVRDNGAGMTAQVLAKAFQPFYTTKPVGQGTGLGLSTVYGIVEGAHGRLHVNSEPGVGSLFQIYFPAVEAVPQSKAPAQPAIEEQDITVLVVEDNGVSRRIVRAILESGGMTVIEAHDGHSAMRIIGDLNCHLDLIISDLVMPLAGGTEVVAHARKHRPGLPVILSSGYAPSRLSELAPDIDVPFVDKPVKRDRLLHIVAEVLAGAAETSGGEPAP